ncbi:UNVERIFIED_CONTAM: hypothetical protein FKN15_027755 [Acipenser sinensis]
MNCAPHLSLLICIYALSLSECNAVHPVYAVMGGSVFLHMEKNHTLHYSDLMWRKDDQWLVRLKKSEVTFYGNYKSRAELFTNGTLRIDNTEQSDAGNYSAEYFEDGKSNHEETHQLIITGMTGAGWYIAIGVILPLMIISVAVLYCYTRKQQQNADPVSQPVLKYSCLPDGEVQFYCSVENGSDPVFQWSLNGNTLDGDSVFHSVRKHVLVVYNDSGSLVCSALNHVSKKQSDLVSFTCAVLLTPVPQQEDEMPDHPSPPEDRVCTTATELSTFTY